MADEQESNWLDDFVGIMSGATETVRNVVDTIDTLTKEKLPSPVSVPVARAQSQETHDVQGERRVPARSDLDAGGWLPVVIVVIVLLFLVKA